MVLPVLFGNRSKRFRTRSRLDTDAIASVARWRAICELIGLVLVELMGLSWINGQVKREILVTWVQTQTGKQGCYDTSFTMD